MWGMWVTKSSADGPYLCVMSQSEGEREREREREREGQWSLTVSYLIKTPQDVRYRHGLFFSSGGGVLLTFLSHFFFAEAQDK